MRILFFGSDGLALPALRQLMQQDWCEIVLVVTQPDRPAGRKQLLTPTAVKKLAVELNLTVTDNFGALPEADLGVVVYYGAKIPAAVIAHFPHGIINIHPSLLPRWRGPSPIKSALLAGETVTGVTVMLIDSGLDTGPILAQKNVSILPTETAVELEQRLGDIGAELLVETIPPYMSGDLLPTPQSQTGVTLSTFITKADGELRLDSSQRELWNHYRALQPWPGVFFTQAGKRYKITAAHWADEKFCIDRIQPEGKTPMTLAEFKRGYPDTLIPNII